MMLAYREFSALTTTVAMIAQVDREDDMAYYERWARYFLSVAEQRFSRFRVDSELSQLNRSAGKWFFASPEMIDLLHIAQQMHFATLGLFDPTILHALQRVGYRSRSADSDAIQPDRSPSAGTFADIRLDARRGQVFLPEGQGIDLGGIAKGWLAAQMGEELARQCDACAIGVGGDWSLHGIPPSELSWQIAIEDPRDPVVDLALVSIPEGGLATSSRSKRTWQQGGVQQHHIIDPRTRQPGQTEWLSVTVWAPQAPQAEAFAKAIFLAGPDHADSLASSLPGVRYLAISPDGTWQGTLPGVAALHQQESQ